VTSVYTAEETHNFTKNKKMFTSVKMQGNSTACSCAE